MKFTTKNITIALLGLFALGFVAWYFFGRKRKEMEADAAGDLFGCVKSNPNHQAKFAAWDDNNVPNGELYKLAQKYAPNENPQDFGAVIGGFFKGVNVFPSVAAARYFEKDLKAYIQSNQALPLWNVANSEFLCQN